MSEQTAEILAGFVEACNAHDVRALIDLYADEFSFEDVALDLRVNDAGEYYTLLNAWFAAIPDLRMDVRSTIACSDGAAITWVLSGTIGTLLPGMPEGFVVGGVFDVRGASVLHFGPSRTIVRHEDYHLLHLQALGTGVPGDGA
ncbi:nuclear transport factor 2 family protein [Streptomyces sp. NPDC058953]|uniref:nuclear transport factor 2 family protein n=1 Tax=unclassified Streptomyces TaxID=2593676 RepID=UPI0036A538EB